MQLTSYGRVTVQPLVMNCCETTISARDLRYCEELMALAHTYQEAQSLSQFLESSQSKQRDL